jgi:hypothetical protein
MQRVSGRGQAREVFSRAVDGTAPVERRILCVTLAQAPRYFRLHQFGAEIERVRAVVVDAESGE